MNYFYSGLWYHSSWVDYWYTGCPRTGIGPFLYTCFTNPLLGNKINFYSFYYYFRTNPPEHHLEVDEAAMWPSQRWRKSSSTSKLFQLFLTVFKPRNLINLNYLYLPSQID